jgi:cytochrome c553
MDRWSDYPIEDLYAWIRNSQALVASGHPRANEVYNQYNKVLMTAFPNLTDQNITDLLAYVNGVADGTYGTPVVINDPINGENAESKGLGKWVYAALLGFLALLALILARVIGNLNVIAARKDNPDAPIERKSILDILTSKGVIGFVLFGLIILGGYTTVNNAVSLGRQQGYAPEQPIKFSHKTHAGLNKIDCQYCHDGARRSKHSVIPATNTCINCHKAITYGSEHGTAEITKIFASIGFDPIANKYIDNYEDMSDKDVEKLFKEWIVKGNSELNEKMADATDTELTELADDQWEEIVASLTNEQKKTVKGPIEWVRIHNLPDHVYFNHAQHVSVGGVECQTCHGQVEEMEVVQQMSPLSMGWCINCHRQTEVNFQGDYYSAYEDYHKELESGDRLKVTVEDIGGLECQKCHY